jgi:hypothetical protein
MGAPLATSMAPIVKSTYMAFTDSFLISFMFISLLWEIVPRSNWGQYNEGDSRKTHKNAHRSTQNPVQAIKKANSPERVGLKALTKRGPS